MISELLGESSTGRIWFQQKRHFCCTCEAIHCLVQGTNTPLDRDSTWRFCSGWNHSPRYCTICNFLSCSALSGISAECCFLSPVLYFKEVNTVLLKRHRSFLLCCSFLIIWVVPLSRYVCTREQCKGHKATFYLIYCMEGNMPLDESGWQTSPHQKPETKSRSC